MGGGDANIGEESDNPVEINATAMIDVTLCLCAFFMCSFHFKTLEGKVETWLPRECRHYHGGCGGVIAEARIFMKWDAEQKVTLRKVGNRGVVKDDAELVEILEQCRKDFEKAGRTRVPLIIDGTPDVPWQDVVHVVDLFKKHPVWSIEFAEPMQFNGK